MIHKTFTERLEDICKKRKKAEPVTFKGVILIKDDVVSDFEKDRWTMKEIADWHEKTFPDATLDGQCKKWQEEYKEFRASEGVLEELADMYIVACGLSRFDNVCAMNAMHNVGEFVELLGMRLKDKGLAHELFDLVVAYKMAKNMRRVWNKKSGLYKHQGGDNA